MGLLEGLRTPIPRCDARRRRPPGRRCATQVETATRKSELRVVEDQVDAVVCAYVALFADRRPGA